MANRTISGILSVMGGRVGMFALGAIITPFLVRILGRANYGDYAFLLSMFAIISTFTHAGISAGIRKFIAEDRNELDWQDHVFAFYARLGVGLAIGGGGVLILFGLYGPAERLFGDGFSLYFLFLAFMLVTNQILYVSRYTLMGLNLEYLSETLPVLQKFLYGVLGLSLAFAGYGVAGVLAGTVIASLVCALVAVRMLRERVDLKATLQPVPPHFPRRNLLSFNLLNTVFILLTISLYNVDLLLLQPLSGSHQAGLYKAALVVAQFVWIVPRAVQIVFIHTSSEMWSKEQYDDITKMGSRATRFTLLFTLLLVIGIAGLASEFVALYLGSNFVEAVSPLLLLLPGVVGFAIARPIYAIGQGKGDFRKLIFATGAAATINLVLNLLLIPPFGMNGAAVATSIGYGSMLAFHGAAALRIGYNPFADVRFFRIAFTAILAGSAIYGLTSIIQHRILSLIVVPPVGFGIYTVLALQSKAIDSQEALQIIESFPQPFDRWTAEAVRRVGTSE